MISTMKLKGRHIKQVQDALNAAGYRGYRKEIAERVYDNGVRSLNYDLFPDLAQDMHDIYLWAEARGYDLDLRDGNAVLDIWLYRSDGLSHTVEVYVRRIVGDRVLVSLEPIDNGAVLREAVRLEAGQL